MNIKQATLFVSIGIVLGVAIGTAISDNVKAQNLERDAEYFFGQDALKKQQMDHEDELIQLQRRARIQRQDALREQRRQLQGQHNPC